MSQMDVETADEAATPDGLRDKLRSGVTWWSVGSFAARLSKLVVYLVLVWMLDVADFGLVGMTAAVTSLLYMLSEFGVGVAVIQKKDMPESYASSAFWLNLGASTIMTVVAYAGAPWLARFYGAAEITLLLQVTSLGLVITALRTIPMAMLRKQLRFGVYAALDTAWHALSGVLSIGMAAMGMRYWSIVVPGMVVGLLMTPLWYWAAGWRPRMAFERQVFLEVFVYSRNVVLAAVLAVALGNAAFVIAGRELGAEPAGFIKVMSEYAMFVVYNFAWIVGNVALSGFALKQDDPAGLRSAFTRVFEVLVATMLPLHAVGIVLAPLLFRVVIPPEYAPALPLFQIYLGLAAIVCMTAHVGPFFNAINRSGFNAGYFLIATPLCVAAMWVGCNQGGMVGLAWGAAIGQALANFALLLITPRVLAWARIHYLRTAVPYILPTALSVAAAMGCAWLGESAGVPVWVTLGVAGAMSAAVYPAALLLTARGLFIQLVDDVVPASIRRRYTDPWLRRTGHEST